MGAPNARTDQQNVDRGGAVYRCHVEQEHCEPIPFDVQGEPASVLRLRVTHLSGKPGNVPGKSRQRNLAYRLRQVRYHVSVAGLVSPLFRDFSVYY